LSFTADGDQFLDCHEQTFGPVVVLEKCGCKPFQSLRNVISTAAANHDGQVRLLARKHGSDFIAVHARQLEIEQHGIDGVFATNLNSRWTIGRGQDPVPFFSKSDF
jgi:hypothetical protein